MVNLLTVVLKSFSTQIQSKKMSHGFFYSNPCGEFFKVTNTVLNVSSPLNLDSFSKFDSNGKIKWK